MPPLNDITITFEIEPIVKLICAATKCKNNAWEYHSATCNLKRIDLDRDGRCILFEKRDDERSQTEADSQKET
jgi:hypothetical protein